MMIVMSRQAKNQQQAVDALIELLDLEKIEENIFRGLSPDEDRQRVFGGQVAGQALVAAARTVDADRAVNSLHAYFLRPGDPTVPILYEVDRIRDGRSFTTRRVVAIQHGKAIFNLAASFHIHEDGLEHQLAMADMMFDGRLPPEPDTLPDWQERMAPWKEKMGDWYLRPRPIDHRSVDYEPRDRKDKLPPHQRTWLRADGTLPDDPVLHNCVLTYASDMTLLDTSTPVSYTHLPGWPSASPASSRCPSPPAATSPVTTASTSTACTWCRWASTPRSSSPCPRSSASPAASSPPPARMSP